MRLYIDNTLKGRVSRVEALENENHEIRNKVIAGDFYQSWLDTNGVIVGAYGERIWVHLHDDNSMSIRLLA